MTAAAKAELRPLHHRVNDERGVTMIHFVLVFPIMFLVMVAVLDLGRYFAVVAVLNAGAGR